MPLIFSVSVFGLSKFCIQQAFFSIFRLHRSTMYIEVAYCYRLSSVVCLLVCHSREPCKNNLANRDAICVVGVRGLKEPCFTLGSRSSHVKGQFLGKDMAGHVRQHCYELCKDGEPIEMPFWLRTQVASRNHVLDPM